jgi:hypothetical protein
MLKRRAMLAAFGGQEQHHRDRIVHDRPRALADQAPRFGHDLPAAAPIERLQRVVGEQECDVAIAGLLDLGRGAAHDTTAEPGPTIVRKVSTELRP